MKITRIGMTLLAALAGISTGCDALSPEQPSVGCPVQRVTWNAKYTLVTQTGTGTCGQLPGEAIGFQRYNNPTDPRGAQFVAMRPVRLAAPDAPTLTNPFGNAALSPNSAAVGTLAQDPVNEFCEATGFNAAQQTVGTTARKYEFSNVRFYVTPSAAGSQMSADLTYTETAPAGVCTATYKVDAVWPSNMACGSVFDPVSHTWQTGTVTEQRCKAFSPDLSGETVQTPFVNPDYDLTCVNIVGTAGGALRPRCVPAKPVPSLL